MISTRVLRASDLNTKIKKPYARKPYRLIKSAAELPEAAVYYAIEVERSGVDPGNVNVVDVYNENFEIIERVRTQYTPTVYGLTEIVRIENRAHWIYANSFFDTPAQTEKRLAQFNKRFYIVDKEAE